MGFNSATAQPSPVQNGASAGGSPAVTTSVQGTWSGILTQGSQTVNMLLVLTQSGAQVGGTFAVPGVAGGVSGRFQASQLTLVLTPNGSGTCFQPVSGEGSITADLMSFQLGFSRGSGARISAAPTTSPCPSVILLGDARLTQIVSSSSANIVF